MFNGDGKTKVVAIRHGNTFHPDEPPRRVGRTDLDLAPSGIAQAKALGAHLKKEGLIPHAVVSSSLRRTLQTAQYLLHAMEVSLPVTLNGAFNEIDYGPDENQPEERVLERIGASALRYWDEQGIPPEGWKVNPDKIVQSWRLFLQRALHRHAGQTLIVVTSNGIARFLPRAIDISVPQIKLKTGSCSVLEYGANGWSITRWNERP